MDRTKWPAILGLVASIILLTSSAQTTFAFDKPFHSTIVFLGTLGAAILGVSRLLPRGERRSHKGGEYSAIPLEDVHTNGGPREHSPSRMEDVAYPSSLRKLRIVFLVLVAAICARAGIARAIVLNVQCATATWEPIVPLAFTLWEWATVHRKKRNDVHDDGEATLYEIWEMRIMRAPYRYLVAVGITCFSALAALRIASSPASTHICAVVLPHRWAIPLLQHGGIVLDIVILACVGSLLHQEEGRGKRSPALRFSTLGWAALGSAVVLSIIATIFFIASDGEDQERMLAISSAYFWSVIRMDFLLCVLAVCMLFCIYHIGTMNTTIVLTFTSITTHATSYAWAHVHPYPMRHAGLGLLAISIATLAFTSYFHIESASESLDHGTVRTTFKKVPAWFYLTMLILLITRACLWGWYNTTVTYHPADLLIWEAKTHHEAYVNQTSASKTLDDAVRNYQQRYNRHPPPGFDKWYNYATERKSIVIDDFDSIYRDLLPFRALSPDVIRKRTWEMIANPWNDAAGISIRAGKADISPNVMPTHRWMLDGILQMMGHFAEWLPDMDIAFNLNDECRVAVPYEDIEPMRQIGRDSIDLNWAPATEFSVNRAETWTPIPEEPIADTPLIHISFQRSFYRFGSVGCPPGSPARDNRHWDLSSACTSCYAPQSLGAFLANWTIAADVCHQPDLADLHGLYLSPAAFKGAHALYPIFSQSKASGFNDILYPSAWNYMDKAVYAPNDESPDPPYAEKNATLFWRGATSEGVSPGHGQWRGMARQRFNHLANSINDSNLAQTMLLPTSMDQNATSPKLAYTRQPVSSLSTLISTDVHFVDSILRCGGTDCPDQAAEFAPMATPTDFQSHWRYKYLLDLDGAGFSGRFLPFLHSNSLPFKAALFREWWDDRVTPWMHFVPLDLRGHGMWATLAYFAGLEGRLGGREVKWEAREREGERIAREGREWANKVLRKDDMEIYFFRLLLEWGRLTDDRRDELGFAVNVAGAGAASA